MSPAPKASDEYRLEHAIEVVRAPVVSSHTNSTRSCDWPYVEFFAPPCPCLMDASTHNLPLRMNHWIQKTSTKTVQWHLVSAVTCTLHMRSSLRNLHLLFNSMYQPKQSSEKLRSKAPRKEKMAIHTLALVQNRCINGTEASLVSEGSTSGCKSNGIANPPQTIRYAHLSIHS